MLSELAARLFGRPKPEEIVRRVPRFEELWNIAGTIDDESPRIAPPSASDSSETEGESTKPASAHEASSDVLTNQAVADRRLVRGDAPLNLKDNSEPHATGECTDTVVATISNTSEPNSGPPPVGAVAQPEPKPPSRSTAHRRKQMQRLADEIAAERKARLAAEGEIERLKAELEQVRSQPAVSDRVMALLLLADVNSPQKLEALLKAPKADFDNYMRAAMSQRQAVRDVLATMALQQRMTHGAQ